LNITISISQLIRRYRYVDRVFGRTFGIFSLFLLLLTGALALSGCTESPPEPRIPSIELEAIDATCTEAWLRLRINDGSAPPYDIKLARDGEHITDLRLLTSDSLIIDDGLLPNRTYTYTAIRPGGSPFGGFSARANVTTLDTTSHDFVWEIHTLGDGYSVLYDVTIINDTLAYAVGEIYLRDSLGNWDPLPYNLVKWDGQKWELRRVNVMYRGNLITPSLNGIFAFSPTDIWLSAGVPIHGDGQNWTQYHLFDMGILTQNDGSINKIWGIPDNLYFVGNRGTIAHYSNGTWRRLETGTSGNMVDVWGYTDQAGGTPIVFAVGGTPGNIKLLSLTPVEARDTLSWPPTQSLGGVWLKSRTRVYAAGAGIWRYQGSSWERMAGMPPGAALVKVRGSAENNIFAIGGSYGNLALLMHFNGVTWVQYPQLPQNIRFRLIAVSDDAIVVVAVGTRDGKGVITVGRRR
jgi:hypothetical protein